MDPSIVPENVWVKILLYCDVPDIIHFSHTCTFLQDIGRVDYLWRKKWLQLVLKAQLSFPDLTYFPRHTISLKGMCCRLHRMLTPEENASFLKCSDCSNYTCDRNCIEDSRTEIVIDMGNKYTMVKSADKVRRCFSMFGILKNKKGDKFKRKLLATEKERLQQLDLESLEMPDQIPRLYHTFRIFGSSTNKHEQMKLRKVQEEYRRRKPNPIYERVMNEYYTDVKDVLGIPYMDVISPVEALSTYGMFETLKFFMEHLFHEMELTPLLRKPNAILVLHEPLTMHPCVRTQLLDYLFLEVKIARVCLIPKPLAVSAASDRETCIHVDSGALTTSVAVIIDGCVIPKRCRLLPVGGWHLAYYLKQIMRKEDVQAKDTPYMSMSNLDTTEVKQTCRIDNRIKDSLMKFYRLHIDPKADAYLKCSKTYGCCTRNGCRTFQKYVLHERNMIASEFMYTSLELAKTIKDVTSGLPKTLMEDCLSEILLTGGNTYLPGFTTRLSWDLERFFPRYKDILQLIYWHDLRSMYGDIFSSYAPAVQHPQYIPSTYTKGKPFCVTREEFILFGCKLLGEKFSCNFKA